MKRVTIQDVAKELGLSRNTVAKALNNSESVTYETRYIVIEKACEMGYLKVSPSTIKEFRRRDETEKIKTIVVVARRELSIFWNSIIMGISDAVNQEGCRFMLCFVSSDDEKNLVIPDDLKEDIDGIVLISVFTDKYMEQLLKLKLPTVCFDCPLNTENIEKKVDILVCEGTSSIKHITDHLISNGLRKIGFIGDVTYCRNITERYLGYLDSLRVHGIEPDPRFEAIAHVSDRYYVYNEVFDYLASLMQMPEAFVCANDDIAFFVIRFLKKKGLRVPEDIAVTGYDNVEGLSQQDPILTTVNVSNQMLGRRLVSQVLWRMANPDFPHERIVIDSDVIFRESSEKHAVQAGESIKSN